MSHAAHSSPPTRTDSERTRGLLKNTLRELNASGVHPTARELAAKAGMSHGAVRNQIAWLLQEGTVEIREVPSRTVRQELVLIESSPIQGEAAS